MKQDKEKKSIDAKVEMFERYVPHRIEEILSRLLTQGWPGYEIAAHDLENLVGEVSIARVRLAIGRVIEF